MMLSNWCIAALLLAGSHTAPSSDPFKAALQAVIGRDEVALRLNNPGMRIKLDVASMRRFAPEVKETDWTELVEALGPNVRSQTVGDAMKCKSIPSAVGGTAKVCSMAANDLILHVPDAAIGESSASITVSLLYWERRGPKYPEGGNGSVTFGVRLSSSDNGNTWIVESVTVTSLS